MHESQPDMEELRGFLIDSGPLAWLIDRLKTTAGLYCTGLNYSDIRSTLIELTTGKEVVQAEFQWTPRAFLEDQYDVPNAVDLADIICVVGTTQNAQATTCGAYVEQVWPSVGRKVLECVSTAARNPSREHEGMCFNIVSHQNGRRLAISTRWLTAL